MKIEPSALADEVESFVDGRGSGNITGTMDRQRWNTVIAALRASSLPEEVTIKRAAALLEERARQMRDPCTDSEGVFGCDDCPAEFGKAECLADVEDVESVAKALLSPQATTEQKGG